MMRIGMIGGFPGIARRSHRRMSAARGRMPLEPDVATEDAEYVAYLQELQPLESEIVEAASITIIFVAIAAEAYIYDFAARQLGDTFVERHLDRLSLQSKWVVVPRLATGYQMSTDGQAFQVLGEISRDRNEIIHHKTRDASTIWGTAQMKNLLRHGEDLHVRADRAIGALDLLQKESAKFDPILSSFFDEGRDDAS